MVKKVHEVMAQLSEDETSYLLTTVYTKCQGLKLEKIQLNLRQAVELVKLTVWSLHDYYKELLIVHNL